jgi:hypothetical protein
VRSRIDPEEHRRERAEIMQEELSQGGVRKKKWRKDNKGCAIRV